MTATVRSADGIPIRYAVQGQGEPAIVFVHGWSCDGSYWDALVEPFAARHRVVLVDLAGHGESGAGRSVWTMPAFGEDVVAVVEDLDLQRVVLVGHSMGGDVVVETALRLPGRVAGLVWVDVYGRLGTPRTREQVETFVAPFRDDFATSVRAFVRRILPGGTDPALVERIAEDMASAPKDAAIDAMIHAVSNDGAILGRLEQLAPLGISMVAIQPEHGTTDVESLAGYGIRVVFQPGVGHFPMLEQPAAFARLLEHVLAGMLAPPR